MTWKPWQLDKVYPISRLSWQLAHPLITGCLKRELLPLLLVSPQHSSSSPSFKTTPEGPRDRRQGPPRGPERGWTRGPAVVKCPSQWKYWHTNRETMNGRVVSISINKESAAAAATCLPKLSSWRRRVASSRSRQYANKNTLWLTVWPLHVRTLMLSTNYLKLGCWLSDELCNGQPRPDLLLLLLLTRLALLKLFS